MVLPLVSWAVKVGSPKGAGKSVNASGTHWVFWWFLTVIMGSGATVVGKGVRDLGFGVGIVVALFAGWSMGLRDGWVLPLVDAGLGGAIWAGLSSPFSSLA